MDWNEKGRCSLHLGHHRGHHRSHHRSCYRNHLLDYSDALVVVAAGKSRVMSRVDIVAGKVAKNKVLSAPTCHNVYTSMLSCCRSRGGHDSGGDGARAHERFEARIACRPISAPQTKQ